MARARSASSRRWAGGDMRGTACSLATLVILGVLPCDVTAATFVVNATNDTRDARPWDGVCADASGACTLRAAIMEANVRPDIDRIELAAATYTLDRVGANEDSAFWGDLDISEGLRIVGQGPGATRIVASPGFGDRILDVRSTSPSSPGIVYIENCTLERGGWSSPASGDDGGGIRALSTDLHLDDVDIRECSGQEAAGLFLQISSLHARRLRLLDNYGNGMKADQSSTILDESLVESSQGCGLISDNSALLLWDCTIARNLGGGVRTSGARIAIFDFCSFTENSVLGAGGGLGVWSLANQVFIENCTFTGNVALPDPAGLGGVGGAAWCDNSSEVNFNHVTIAGNGAAESAGALASYSTRVVMKGCVIAGNQAPSSPEIYSTGMVESQGWNVLGDLAGSSLTPHATDVVGVLDPLLGSLQDNGGLTLTMLPMGGSPALDTCDPADCLSFNGNPLLRDQRGFLRPVDGDGDSVSRCDSGAVELAPDNDGDTVADVLDCAPGDAGAMRVPGEPVLLVGRDAGTANAVLSWTDLATTAGSGTRYDVASELLSVLHGASRIADAPCVQAGLSSIAWTDSRPVTRDGWYYLVRGVNVCGPAPQEGWGSDSLGRPRPACP